MFVIGHANASKFLKLTQMNFTKLLSYTLFGRKRSQDSQSIKGGEIANGGRYPTASSNCVPQSVDNIILINSWFLYIDI